MTSHTPAAAISVSAVSRNLRMSTCITIASLLLFPLLARAQTSPPPVPATDAVGVLRVLFAADNPTNRMLALALLKRRNARVVVAENGVEEGRHIE